MMVVLGVDAHKKSHTIVAADGAGAELGEVTVAATPAGHLRAVRWAARLDGPAREIKLLVDYREGLVRERTAAQNRLRWRLHELEPGFDPPPGSLNRYKTLNQIDVLLQTHTGLVATLAGREVARIRQITREANQLERDIAALVAEFVPSLLELSGCGALTAAKLVGEAADITRFRNKDGYAMWSGAAPIPVWSANSERFRLNRGGNRQTNAALHRIAITQFRMHPQAKTFIERRIGLGNNKRQALRSLKRRLSDVVYRKMLKDAQAPQHAQTLAA